jgi:NitT/TauT family transport system ATP-binding protein
VSAPRTAARGAAISLAGVDIDFTARRGAVKALAGVEFAVAAGEFVSLLGPSGCGKSTVIGAVAGFTPVTRGTLEVDGQPVSRPSPERAVVFQSHTLFPWKTVLANVEFGLKVRGIGRRERRRAAEHMLLEVGLADFLEHYPEQLSGGMQQRVNLARALVTYPRVLLMDEPFCALDAQTRIEMQKLLLALWQERKMTVVFVTHDVDEAVFLSDRVLVLSERPGRVHAELEVALPRPRTHDLFTAPDFVALKRRGLDSLLSASTRRPRASEPATESAPAMTPAFSTNLET